MYIPEKKSDDKLLMIDRFKQMFNEEPKPLPPPEYAEDDFFDRMKKQHDENQQKKKELEKKMNQKKLE